MSALVLMIVNAPPRAITRPPSRESEQLAQVRARLPPLVLSGHAVSLTPY
jgi:hypothetical protein